LNEILKIRHQFNTFQYSNELELISTIIKIYSLVSRKQKLTEKEEDILMFYIKYGYSAKTKNAIVKDVKKNNVKDDHTKITKKHLDVINHALKNKGYLDNHPTNGRLKVLSKDLQNLSDVFMNRNGEKMMYLIGFDKI